MGEVGEEEENVWREGKENRETGGREGRGDKGRRMEEKNKSQWGINKQMKQACKHWSVYLLELCRYKGLSLDWTQLPPEGLT